MGYTTRNGGLITDYWPDESDNEFYIESDSNPTLQDILDKVSKKWPNASFENITIYGDTQHTSCITYDLYDPSDYTNFICISYKGD